MTAVLNSLKNKHTSKMQFLESMSFHISSKEPNIVKLHVFGETTSIPIEKIKQLAKSEII